MSAQAPGSPSKASGVTPKQQMAPANSDVGLGHEHHEVLGRLAVGAGWRTRRRELHRVVDDVAHRPGPQLVVELVGQVGVRGRRTAGFGGWSRWALAARRAVDRSHREADGAADELDVVAGQHDAPHREAERLDRIAERTELRRHGAACR